MEASNKNVHIHHDILSSCPFATVAWIAPQDQDLGYHGINLCMETQLNMGTISPQFVSTITEHMHGLKRNKYLILSGSIQGNTPDNSLLCPSSPLPLCPHPLIFSILIMILSPLMVTLAFS